MVIKLFAIKNIKNRSESFKHHSEHFVVNNSEITSVCGPNKIGQTLLIDYYFVLTLKVVSERKVTVRFVVGVAVIRNA